MWPDSVDLTYRATVVVWGIGVILSSAEFLARREQFGSGGIHSWRISGLRLRRSDGKSFRLADAVFGRSGMQVMLWMRLALVPVLMISDRTSLITRFVFFAMLANDLAFSWRRLLGDDGSDQMNSIILATLCICVGFSTNPAILKIGLWFIACQAMLSYLSAGTAKLVSPIWRTGQAVPAIFGTATYGSRSIVDAMSARPSVGRALSIGTIAGELAFPLAVILPPPFGYPLLIVGLGFHLGCAFVMGLNTFLWAFAATYPSVMYLATELHGGR